MIIDWYFDFLSPFVHLQAEDFNRRGWPVALRCKPVLFAGLLNHWGQLGPAEIPPKKRFIFRQCLWRAHRMGAHFQAPPIHPFPPLTLLRLAIAIDATPQQVLEISRFVWRDGHVAEDEAPFKDLLARLNARDALERINTPAVKETLRRNGEEAVARGVFGVPTLMAGEELFWGEDATDMCIDFIQGATLFSTQAMGALDHITEGATRKRA